MDRTPNRPPKLDRLADAYPFAGLGLSFLSLVAGVALVLLKAVGGAVWDGTFVIVRLHVTTATPGVVCILLAPVFMYLSRPNAR